MFGKLFKKKVKVSKKEFGELALSGMLLISAKKSPDLFEELNVEMKAIHYLIYLEYLLFIAEKILEQRFSSTEIEIIIDSTIDGLIKFMDILPDDKKEEANRKFREMYTESETYFEEICSDIGSENGLKNLASAFLEDCGIGKDLFAHMRVFAEFSTLIIYHSESILGKGIIIT